MDESFADGSSYDPQTVAFYDVAHEGAHVRLVAGAAHELERLYGFGARSVIIVCTDEVSATAARLAVAARTPLRLPIVVTTAMPTYVGPLDIVMVIGDREDAPEVAMGLIRADGRGAPTVLVGPASGPIIEDAPDRCIVVPSLPTSKGASPARAAAAVTCVVDLLEEDPSLVSERLNHIADAIDEELQQLLPERDELVNPGRQLRALGDGAVVVHVGGPVAEAAAAVWTAHGMPSAHISAEEYPAMMSALPSGGPSRDIFFDPFLDDPGRSLPIKSVLWGAEADGDMAKSVARPELGLVGSWLVMLTRALAATAYTD